MMQSKYRGNTRFLEVKIVDDWNNKRTCGNGTRGKTTSVSAPWSKHDCLEISTVMTNVLVGGYKNAKILKLN